MMDVAVRLRWGAQALLESESSGQPFNGLGHVSINQDGNHGAGRRGTILNHKDHDNEQARALYCRKGSAGGNWNVILLVGGTRLICAGSEAGEIAEVVNQMRLIRVTELRGQRAPIGHAWITHRSQQTLQPPHARESLGRQSGVSAKTP